MSDLPKKRSLTIKGHRTSISLEDAFWQAARTIAASQHIPVAQLVETIDTNRNDTGLSSAIRLYVLAHYQNQLRNQ